jgi:hypothetical protein
MILAFFLEMFGLNDVMCPLRLTPFLVTDGLGFLAKHKSSRKACFSEPGVFFRFKYPL